MNRREFVHGVAGAASGLLVVRPATAFGYPANSAIRHGLLGCGNRGTHVAESFSQNTQAQVVALADLFPDQLAAAHAHFNDVNATLGRAAIDANLLFHGPHAFEQLAGSAHIDLIQISTPPFFHVEHLQAAVAAGKHVYCEKPAGIDIAQARQALAIGKRLQSTQSVDVGFQCRSAPPIAAIAEKIHAGALGKIGALTGYYFAPASVEKVVPGTSADEHRLRNWLWDRALSGDILVEQNIHIIDLANWMLGAHPLKATVTGGRSILTHAGDCWDNYQVEFTYPGDIRFSFSSTQFGSYGFFDAGLRLFGAEGAASVPYAGAMQIVGSQPWAWTEAMNAAASNTAVSSTATSSNATSNNAAPQGKFAANGAFGDNLAFADRDKERTFIESIVTGPVHNQIADGVESALSCMLGRMAGLRGHEVTWDDLLAHGENYQLGMSLDQFA